MAQAARAPRPEKKGNRERRTSWPGGDINMRVSEEEVAKQKEYADIALGFLRCGLQNDQAGEVGKALEFYRKGLGVIEDFMTRYLDELSAEERDQVKGEWDQMCRHQTNFGHRVQTLGVVERGLHSQTVQPKTQTAPQGEQGGGSGGWKQWFGMGQQPQPQKAEAATQRQTGTPEQDPQLTLLINTLGAPIPVIQPRTRQPAAAATAPANRNSQTVSYGSRPQANNGRPSTNSSFGSTNGSFNSSTSVSPKRPAEPVSAPSPAQQQQQQQQQQPAGGATQRLKSKGVDVKLVDSILSSVIVPQGNGVQWDDVVGLDGAKQALFESAVLPLQRPDLFTGLRQPARAVLLFGPPGTGKTFVAKALANFAKASFFNISASSLTSKWVGEGEKTVKALFAAAEELQPAVIFVDEVDSLLTSRSDNENESSRRIKTEFMVQMEGLTSERTNIMILAATNRPMELDDAILRRFAKKILIPLPDAPTRVKLIANMLSKDPNNSHALSKADLKRVGALTEGYSNSDVANLCRESCMQPLRELGMSAATVDAKTVRKIALRDFEKVLQMVRPSANREQLQKLNEWNQIYGSKG